MLEKSAGIIFEINLSIIISLVSVETPGIYLEIHLLTLLFSLLLHLFILSYFLSLELLQVENCKYHS